MEEVRRTGSEANRADQPVARGSGREHVELAPSADIPPRVLEAMDAEMGMMKQGQAGTVVDFARYADLLVD